MEHQNIRGEKVPSLGMGTYRLTGEDCVGAVGLALSMGYRHLDTAQMYGNEAEVGRGMEDSGVDRGEIFLTTKVWPSDYARDRVLEKTRESVKKLRTEYVDLLLMHWPPDGVPLGETLGAMRELQEGGLVRHVGVSNFSPSLAEEAAGHADVFCNQVEYHVYRKQDALLDQAREMDYLLVAYRPLSRGGVEGDATLREVGEAHGKTAAQVALRWLVQQEKVSAIPKATGEDHLRANLDVFDFELSGEEMDRVSALGR
ncbi:MAG TPA: aldo/keto reductase [Rubrobacter sp.]|nr:aldo/keto reductase [Rubrobacter sp.]